MVAFCFRVDERTTFWVTFFRGGSTACVMVVSVVVDVVKCGSGVGVVKGGAGVVKGCLRVERCGAAVVKGGVGVVRRSAVLVL